MRRGFQHRAHAVLPRDQAGQDLEAAQLAFRLDAYRSSRCAPSFLERVDRAFHAKSTAAAATHTYSTPADAQPHHGIPLKLFCTFALIEARNRPPGVTPELTP